MAKGIDGVVLRVDLAPSFAIALAVGICVLFVLLMGVIPTHYRWISDHQMVWTCG